jgi:hypothetical protein
MIGPDERIDEHGDCRPANELPLKCPHCTFPDLDYIANPYILARGISIPAETAPARLGNFLIRDRVRLIFELAVPGACSFHSTDAGKTKVMSPWWLAVPKRKLQTPWPKPSPPFCSKCGEPKVWWSPMGPTWEKMRYYDTGEIDVFKTAEWGAMATVEDSYEEANAHRKKSGLPPLTWSERDVPPPSHPERWTRGNPWRDLYFSVRLEQLLKRARVKGQLVRALDFKDVELSGEDVSWIEERLAQLRQNGLVGETKPAKNVGAQRWFRDYLKKNARQRRKPVNFDRVETKHHLALPQDYKNFILTVGPKSFRDVNETEGFRANVLPPERLNFKDYRRGKVPGLDEEESHIDGVMFASTEHGDCFLFDVSVKGNDYPVFWWDHEQNMLEPFAANFAECIQRFAQRD